MVNGNTLEQLKQYLEQAESYSRKEVDHSYNGFGLGIVSAVCGGAIVWGISIDPSLHRTVPLQEVEAMKFLLCAFGGVGGLASLTASVANFVHASRDKEEAKRYFGLANECLDVELLKTEKTQETTEIQSQDGTIEGKINDLEETK